MNRRSDCVAFACLVAVALLIGCVQRRDARTAFDTIEALCIIENAVEDMMPSEIATVCNINKALSPVIQQLVMDHKARTDVARNEARKRKAPKPSTSAQ